MKIFISILLVVPFTVSGSQAENLGRLFFTPEQRVQLESRQVSSASSAISTTHSMLIVNGIVQKHSGGRTVWINGIVQNSGQGGDSTEEIIHLPGKSQTKRIKVGQKLLLESYVPQSSPAPSE